MPTKKASKTPRSTPRRPGNSGRAKTKTSPRFTWAVERRAVVAGVIVVIAVIGAAALIADRPSSLRANVRTGGAPSEALIAPESPTPQLPDTRLEPTHIPAAVRAETKKASPKPRVAMSTTETHTAPSSVAAVAAVESPKTVPVAAVEPVDTAAPRAPAVESTPDAAVEKVAAVTITGCLERDDESFWLKDTSGTNAPKVRSWKSGFFKKSPARIELVDASSSLRLPNFVGQRVAATGTLVNREMQPHSLRRLASSCSEP